MTAGAAEDVSVQRPKSHAQVAYPRGRVIAITQKMQQLVQLGTFLMLYKLRTSLIIQQIEL